MDKIAKIKEWLGAGSINIFGLPMSGKDTVGVKLAEALGGKFLSSGLIIRTAAQEGRDGFSMTEYAKGGLTPSELFYSWILPYFSLEELRPFPLVLSMVGRWSGEERAVMEAAANGGHEMKAVLLLNISEADVRGRFESVLALGDRDKRADDKSERIFTTRLEEFHEKVMPTVESYRQMGLIVPVQADGTREEVFNRAVDKLYDFAIDKSPGV